MNNSSISPECDPEKLSLLLLSTTKKELRNLKRKEPQTLSAMRTELFQAHLEAKRIYQQTKLAIVRLNSL